MSAESTSQPPETPRQPDDEIPMRAGEQPSPEAKRAAEPEKAAVKAAIQTITTPAEAEHVAATALAAAAGKTEEQVRAQPGPAPLPAPDTAAQAGPASAVLVDAARRVANSTGEPREALELVLQEATNPEQQGGATPDPHAPLALLREAFLKHMNPFQALDARLFLAINQLPHTSMSNRLMSGVTAIMTGGMGWLLGLLVGSVLGKRRARQALFHVVPPLWLATLTVEYPIKYYFRRKRPFVDIVQAIAVGKKPGSYSFPSGHSAAAFAGAWLLRRHYPQLTALWYAIATLVGFSRIYLGAHYPSDVISGGLAGTLLAEATRQVIDRGDTASR